MDKQNELVEYYNGISDFSRQDVREKVKKFLLDLKDDKNKGNTIRSYAALICHKKYGADLKPYYPLIKNTILKMNIKKGAAEYILGNLKYLSRDKTEIKEIIAEAAQSGSAVVKDVIKK